MTKEQQSYINTYGFLELSDNDLELKSTHRLLNIYRALRKSLNTAHRISDLWTYDGWIGTKEDYQELILPVENYFNSRMTFIKSILDRRENIK